jgi:CheY-like chemotaxis protein
MVYGRNKSLLFKLDQEVRQSLHHLMGMLELTAEEPLSPAQESCLSQCRAGADRLLQIANDVTEICSPERSHSPASTFCLTTIVEEVAAIMSVLARRKGLEFHLLIDPSSPQYVFSERETIQDMLRRLLDNSIQFTARGSVTLSVAAEPLNGPDSALIFEVIDTGPGIAKEILEEFQAPAESTRTGFGLSVVQRRLADMNGQLTVQSSASDGTALRISLPVKLAVSLPPAVKAANGDPAGQPHAALPLRLLVAEDSNDGFNVFRVYVKGAGHSVSRAVNGADAVEMVKANEYDLVVMDIDMPVMDGYTATRIIREWETQQGRARVPIVMLSAESASRQRQIGASAGCSGYLTKPATKAQVLAALNFYAQPAFDPHWTH